MADECESERLDRLYLKALEIRENRKPGFIIAHSNSETPALLSIWRCIASIVATCMVTATGYNWGQSWVMDMRQTKKVILRLDCPTQWLEE